MHIGSREQPGLLTQACTLHVQRPQACSAGVRRIAGLESVCKSLWEVIVQHLFERGAWHPSRCHVLGFSQGGTVALELTRVLAPGLSLGSCVAVSAGFLPEWLLSHDASVDVLKVGLRSCLGTWADRVAPVWVYVLSGKGKLVDMQGLPDSETRVPQALNTLIVPV